MGLKERTAPYRVLSRHGALARATAPGGQGGPVRTLVPLVRTWCTCPSCRAGTCPQSQSTPGHVARGWMGTAYVSVRYLASALHALHQVVRPSRVAKYRRDLVSSSGTSVVTL